VPEDYDNFAEFYEAKYADVTHDLEFFIEMARRAGANPRILELACGNGRVTLPLLEAGFRVTGMDISEKMLEIARRKVAEKPALAERAHFLKGDMRNFRLEEQFDFIFIPLSSFQHLLEQSEQLACLQSIRQHLAPAGLFIVDIYNPETKVNYPADGRVELAKEFTNPLNGNRVQTFLSITADIARQVRQTTFFFDEIFPDGTVRRTVAPLKLRYTYRFEMQLLLEKAGFSIEELYGSHEFDELDEDSDRLIFVCRRG
jgi:SAM-dependent methyltransferase